MLRDTSLDAMVGTALRHDRASSYNNVLASSDGGVVNVEGSATSAEMTEPDERGHLVHTNHYVCDAMLPYEGDPAYARRSAVRYARAEQLLAAQADGTMTEERMREILSDHEHAPDSLCRHAQDGVAGFGHVLLVRCRCHRHADHVRARQPVRFRRTGVRVLRLSSAVRMR